MRTSGRYRFPHMRPGMGHIPSAGKHYAAGLVLMLTAFLVAPPSASAEDADAKKGRIVFNQCRACHQLVPASGQTRKIGPHLQGLFGRQVASVEGYAYSQALQDADFVWTADKLSEWLRAPRSFLPGNRMPYAGLRRESDRNNLIAYLQQALEAPQ